MRTMKDSGIAWIGEIPDDWRIIRNKNAFTCSKELVGEKSELTQLLSLTTRGIKKKDINNAEGKLPESFDTYQFVKENDLVMCLFDLDCSAVFSGISPYNGMISPAYRVLSCKKCMEPKYADYWFQYISDGRKFNHYAKNIRYTLSYEEFSALPLLLPERNEQRRIADYLNRKCSQIDAIIARQQEVIEKLKAYKLSIITEAVTKGLNPDVPMKDSGVEWIGEIPVHWDFRRIKNCCLIVDCKNRTPDPDPDGEYIVVRTTCIRDGSFSYEGSYHTNAENFKEWTAKGQPQHGDIFFTREAPMGEACLVPDADNLCMGQRVMFFRPLYGSDPRYILYSIYSPLAREYIDSKNKGSTVGHLKLGQVASLPLFYCPPKEQSEIADYLDKRCGAIDKVVEKKTEIISKLTDYKKSFIYEVVTGKKEV